MVIWVSVISSLENNSWRPAKVLVSINIKHYLMGNEHISDTNHARNPRKMKIQNNFLGKLLASAALDKPTMLVFFQKSSFKKINQICLNLNVYLPGNWKRNFKKYLFSFLIFRNYIFILLIKNINYWNFPIGIFHIGSLSLFSFIF